MKNEYQLYNDGSSATIWLRRMDGTIWGATVDATDLPLVAHVPNTWFAQWDQQIPNLLRGNLVAIAGWL